jgi:hypothetical protein
MTIHDAIYQHSLPTEEVISSLSTNGAIHVSQLVPQVCKLYLGQRLRQNINCLLIGGDVLENHFSLLEFITEKIVLDLNVLRLVMEHEVL